MFDMRNTKAEILEGGLKLYDQFADALVEIERLRKRNTALVECLRGSRCPVDYRVTVEDCQQCGCTHGLLIR